MRDGSLLKPGFVFVAVAMFMVSVYVRADVPSAGSKAATVKTKCVSSFGIYKGCTKVRFHHWVTKSVYIPTRDGTRLAADISIPAVNGVAAKGRFPVLWTYTRYQRRHTAKPAIDSNIFTQALVRHGYVVAVVNVRGGGASFGRYEGLFSAAETREGYDVMTWLAKQDFSDGKLGMFGGSYLGITQYMAASTHNPALKAIMPEVSYLNFYDAVRRGGILRSDMLHKWANGVKYLDTVKPPVPVDADKDGSLAREAVAQHANNFDPIAPLTEAKFRDSTAPEFNWLSNMPSAVWNKVVSSHIPIYHMGGWLDAYTFDTLLMFANDPNKEKLMMGPWAHSSSTKKERAQRTRIRIAETLRWYDHWLKGIDNGVMKGPRIHVAIIDKPNRSWTWTSLSKFPDTRVDRFLTASNTEDTHKLPRDFRLSQAQPKQGATDHYTVDPETTTGTKTRWDANFGGTEYYPDMTANDKRSLVFTSAPLTKDVVVMGPPLATVYLSSSKPDADVYVLLEEVDQTGYSYYVSEGQLRASLRKESKSPWKNNLGLPWFRDYKEDQQFLTPGEVVKLDIPMEPTGFRFKKGDRIRFVIMGADKDNTEAPPYPHARLSISVGGAHASKLSLPILTR